MHSRSGMFLALWNGERRCTAWVRGHPDRMQRYPPSQERGQCPPGCSTQAGRPRSQGVPRRGSASSVPSETRRGRDARAPRVCAVVGVRAACPRRRDASGTPALPGCAPSWKRGQCPLQGWVFKPLRAIFRFSHQDAQKPPSPLVGEGGWGDEGQKRSGKQKITHRSQERYP
jgi:hypothetical protein